MSVPSIYKPKKHIISMAVTQYAYDYNLYCGNIIIIIYIYIVLLLLPQRYINMYCYYCYIIYMHYDNCSKLKYLTTL